MPYVKADGTVVYGGGRPAGRLSPADMEYRDRWNRWASLPDEVRARTPPPPKSRDPRAGLMQEYLDEGRADKILRRLNQMPSNQ